MCFKINKQFVIFLLLLILAPSAYTQNATPVGGGVAAGITITNQAHASYSDPSGNNYEVVSPPVSIRVAAVGGVQVTPDETAATGTIIPKEQVTRVFKVCNIGNAPDMYTLTRSVVNAPATVEALYWDVDNSGTKTPADIPITLNTTASPELSVGQCLNVLAIINTGAVVKDNTITIGITAKSNLPGNTNQDDGTIINTVGDPVKVTDPANPTLPPTKLVENKSETVSTIGSTLNYTISFRNRSAITALNVLLTDDLPPELDYLPGTMKLGDKPLTDNIDTDEGQVINTRRLEVKLATVAPDQIVVVTFQGKLNRNAVPGVGVLNTAQVSGDNTGTAIRTSRTKVVINPQGTVYVGGSDGSVPIPGASVILSTDQAGKQPVDLLGTGFDPNAKNANPFASDVQGHFSFGLGQTQLGAPGLPITYFINVAANGYRPRLLEVKIEPTANELFRVDIRSLDGQPIALAGSFTLTNNAVTLPDIAALVLNIPMFETATMQLSKIADKQRVEIGDMVTYRVEALNASAARVTGAEVFDTLPLSFSYIAGTAQIQIDGAPAFKLEPTLANNQLNFKIGDLAPGARVSITYRVRVGVNARTGEQVNIAIAKGFGPTGDPLQTQPAKAPVLVGMGAFSMRQIIIGRIFEDTNGNGLFEKCDRAVAGVRVYMNNGMSVITDSRGMYNFPSVEEGATVVSLDPFTVPKGFALLDERLKRGRSWTRLVRTPLGGGGLNRINFVLEKIVNPITEAVTDVDGSAETFVGVAPNAPAGLTPAGKAPTPKGKDAEAEASENKADENRSANNKSAKARKNANSVEDSTTGGAFDNIFNKRRGPKTRAGLAAMNVGKNGYKAPGKYTEISNETIEPVAPGAIKILSPEPKEVIMENGLRVEARVHLEYGVALEVNGERIPETNIGVKEDDKKNQVTTIVFVGISLKPGPNELKIMPVTPDGQTGQAVAMTVMGRGPATRIEVVTDKKEIQSGGRDSSIVRVKAFDAWGNPAASGQVGIQVSAGRLLRVDNSGTSLAAATAKAAATQTTTETPAETSAVVSGSSCGRYAPNEENPCVTQLAAARGISHEEAEKILRSPLIGAGAEPINGFSAEQVNATNRQQILTLDNGEAIIELIGEGQPGNAEIRAFSNDIQAKSLIRFTPEQRPQILVGLAEASFGKAAPDVAMAGTDKNYRHHTEFFFRSPLPSSSQLTLAYNSFRPLTRTAGRDRTFFLDPLDRVYPVFGDSSTRFEDAQSNSKLYARFDKGRSYAMFGDFDASRQEYVNDTFRPSQITNLAENLASAGIGNSVLNNFNSIPVFANQGPQLTGYNRRLTGVKVHFETAGGSSITASGARPDTAFARDVFAGSSFGLIRLSHIDVLQGSETIVREVRDRRNPDIILQREILVRSVDYNIDPYIGSIYFMRPLSTFDYALNLVQIVATYEYRGVGMNSAVYTARGSKNFNAIGLRVGTSFIDQRQENFGAFYLGGIDIEKKIGKSGSLEFEWGMSNGRVASSGSYFGFDGVGNGLGTTDERNGNAFRADYRQPLSFAEGQLQATFSRSDRSFFNPFGATVTPGSQRGSVVLDVKPIKGAQMRVGFTDERNKTATYDNSRQTGSIGWIQQFGDKLRMSAGYDYRNFTDQSGAALAQNANANFNADGTADTTPKARAAEFAGRTVSSNLVTVGAEFNPNDKTSIAIKREQNLGAADPTYPNQTTVAASYEINSLAKLFFTQRLASQAITSISDVSSMGFAETASRRETAIGVESPLNKYTTMSGRYQINNGINGTDSFAVVGLMNRFPLSKVFSLDAGYERGMHLKGNGDSFNNAMFGFSFNPSDSFRSAARYELRDLNGFGNIFTAGAAGKITQNLTTLGRFQYSRTSFQTQGSNKMMNGQLAAAWRPLDSDRTAFLLSYTYRSIEQDTQRGFAPARDRDEILATDGLYQPFRRLDLYGRFAVKFNSNGNATTPLASSLTMLLQGRAELRLARYFDVASEVRTLWLSSSLSRRTSIGTELGFWALSDLRLAGGYNFTKMRENPGYFGGIGSFNNLNTRKGFYFVVSSKLSNMFNLFGTSREGLLGNEPIQTTTSPETTSPKSATDAKQE